jgi:aryl-alcohol dehydrogenase-like predicted oxidoreductase
MLLIPGTSSINHLRDNLAAATLELPSDLIAELDGIAKKARAAAQPTH